MNLPAKITAFPGFKLNDKQRRANDMLAGDAVHFMAYGGARSGKTFLLVRALIIRALLAPGSRHLMLRFHMVDVKASIVAETWPNVIKACFPALAGSDANGKQLITQRVQDGYFILPNGSEVWYAGLDEGERTEKVLGKEYVTILMEECSQIPWASRGMVVTRLAQKVRVQVLDAKTQQPVPGDYMRPKMFYAENPPLKSHWTYDTFIRKVSFDTKKPLANQANFNSIQMNPRDNADNISPTLLTELDGLSERLRKRFRDGEFGEAGESALWTYELVAQQRLDEEPDINDFIKIVVAIDPSGADNAEDAQRDEIGIVVAGLRRDGTAVVLEDVTFLGGPKEWGEMAVNRARDWGAETIVAETNYGGAMVKFVVQAAAAALNYPVRFVMVTATRGKAVRAEPISVLYEQQKIWHVPGGGLAKLEDELCQFTTFGFTGERSPNRGDAAIWALTYLFPAVLKTGKELTTGRGSGQVNVGHAALKKRFGR